VNVRSALIVIGSALGLAAAIAWTLDARVAAAIVLLLGLPILAGGIALLVGIRSDRNDH
jgi:hypothetical protein